MSLSRAFTTRRNKGSVDLGDSAKGPHRSNTLHKPSSQQPLRHKISAPVNLVHTTNMLSYNAPDVPLRRPSRSGNGSEVAKTFLEDESDTPAVTESTPPTSPDEEPHEPSTTQPNHLSCYFMAPGTGASPDFAQAPAIPKRSPTHTKKNSIDALARKRSVSRMSKESEQSSTSNPSLTFSRSSSTSTRASETSHTSAPHTLKQAPPPVPQNAPVVTPVPQQQQKQQLPAKTDTNPFGQELAQVTELAEEFGAKGRLDVIYEDEQYLKARGLVKMSADDYLNEIHSLMATFWPESSQSTTVGPIWI